MIKGIIVEDKNERQIVEERIYGRVIVEERVYTEATQDQKMINAIKSGDPEKIAKMREEFGDNKFETGETVDEMIAKINSEKGEELEVDEPEEESEKKQALAKFLDIPIEDIEQSEYNENEFIINPRPAKRGESPEYYMDTIKEFKMLIGPEAEAKIDEALASGDSYKFYKEIEAMVPKEPVIKNWLYNVNILYWLLIGDGKTTNNKMIKAWKGEPIEDDREDYESNGGEYLVLTDDEADSEAKESAINLLDDIGIEGLNMNLDNYVNNSWFEDAQRESYQSYADDIENEGDNTYGNRLVREMFEAGVLTDDDFETVPDSGEVDYESPKDNVVDDKKDEFVDWLCEQAGDPVEWFISDFGKDEFNETVKRNGLADYDAIAEYIVDTDGRASVLNHYDGNEDEEEINGTTYYIYRTN